MKRKATYSNHDPARVAEWVRVLSLPKDHAEYMSAVKFCITEKPCPFGCGKAWKNINNHSVKLHVLQKCPMRAGNEQKLVDFFCQKKRGWIILYVSGIGNFYLSRSRILLNFFTEQIIVRVFFSI